MYLVTGASGNVGGPVARQLHEQGLPVRALVRDPARAADLPAGVERFTGDLGDLESVVAALDGVESVFLMQTGPQLDQAKIMTEAVRKAGGPRIVLLSSVGARTYPLEDNPIGQALADREEVLRTAGLDVTYLRPNTFATNALWWRDEIRAGRVTDPTMPGRTVPIDPEDIARAAVVTLTSPDHVGHGYTLTGPEALTAREQVEILADVLDRPIEFAETTPAEYAAASIARGTPPQLAAMMEALQSSLRFGRSAFVTDDVFNLTGTAPGTFRAWAERHAAAF
ncbi:NAD(P)H-binding protein [Catenuloplanes japonicus]|uniref:NAD(P)H-binding protein n=1 Tax=Catenuloplanes japonicus TaxID=33876 RepID=UPI000524666B|nr:NAD(P)H-binding protein [Catenuloplanes japonicus]